MDASRPTALAALLILQACAAPPPAPAPLAEEERSHSPYEELEALFEGRPDRVHYAESLQDPLFVEGWTESELLLRDGSRIAIPGAGDLRRHSILLAELTAWGVESRQGSAIGLMRIWHWCGNDPIRSHEARVSIPALLRYLHQNDDLSTPSTMKKPGTYSSRFGWDVDDFRRFYDWQGGEVDRDRRLLLRTSFPLRGAEAATAVFRDGSYLVARVEKDDHRLPAVHRGFLPWPLYGKVYAAYAMDSPVEKPLPQLLEWLQSRHAELRDPR